MRSSALRELALAALLVAAALFFAWFVNGFYPLRDWLFFFFARCWLLSGLFTVSSLTVGLRLLKAIGIEPPGLGERLILAAALGVLAFFWGLFVGGLLGLYGTIFFYAWPLLLLGFGAPVAWKLVRENDASFARLGYRLLPSSPGEGLAALLGVVSLLGLYLQIVAPANVGADSHWYHLPLAEHYAAGHTIRAFAEGSYLGAYPQLASILYTWAYLGPGTLPDHIALCSHLEWMLFLLTICGVSCLAGRLAGRRMRFGGAALFLFPGVFLYDSSLITGADHILAFWAAPIAITLLRLRVSFTVREAILGGAILSGAVLTKLQASYFLLPAGLLMGWLLLRQRKAAPVVAFGLAGLIGSSAHWFKNWLWYGDPFYPLLHRYLPSHPFHAGAEALLQRAFWYERFLAKGTLAEKLWQALCVSFTFSFKPHDWDFHGNIPVFGSLFTLLLPALVLLRTARRTWLLVVAVHLALMVWFLTSHQDRYLHAIVPWMAAVTAVALTALWQLGTLTRVAASLLVLLQIIWGGDVYFYRTHAMIGDAPLKAAVDFIDAGHRGRGADRFSYGFSMVSLAGALPPQAKVLVHNVGEKLGLQRQSISDAAGWQGGIDYLALDSPAVTSALWRRMGATHVVWLAPIGAGSPEDLAREMVFARAVSEYGDEPTSVGPWRYVTLRETPKHAGRALESTRILWLGCGTDPKVGIYSPGGLAALRPDVVFPAGEAQSLADEQAASANTVAERLSCKPPAPLSALLDHDFRIALETKGVSLLVRR